MASYTEKLNLLKKNPVTDGADTFNIETMMNENWDKIDGFSAFLEASIAPPYSASSAYAVGAWCTYYGKLYQCTTAIGSGGEAWNASHWTAKNTTDLAKDAVKTFVRPNLLDNAYFVGGGSQQGGGQFPVNQRGKTSYTQNDTYTIDRWRTSGSSQPRTLTVNSEGITVTTNTAGGNSIPFLQYFPSLPPGQYTISLLITAKTGKWMVMYDDRVIDVSSGLFTYTFEASSGFGTFYIWSNSNQGTTSISIKAIKLELGDTQTLAHQENGAWVLNEVPNYQQELAKCQRYFVNLNAANSVYPNFGGNVANNSTVAYIPIELPVPMRTVPSISLSNTIGTYYLTNGPTQYTLTDMTMDSFMGSRLKIACRTTGLTTSQFYSLETMSAESIMLSADL